MGVSIDERVRRGLKVLVVGLGLASVGCGGEEVGAGSAGLLDPTGPTVAPGSDPGAAAALAAMDESSRAAIAHAPTPSMLMFPVDLLSDVVVTSGPHFYAVSARHEDLTLSIHATDLVHRGLPDDVMVPPAELTVRGIPARAHLSEAIRGVTWTEAGMTYDLEVECFEALTDARCTEDAFVRDLADRLVEVQR